MTTFHAELDVDLIDRAPTNRPCTLDDGFIASIRAHGVLQPILVHQAAGSDRYDLIAGERRWTAAQQVGHATIPAVVHIDLDTKQLAVMRAVENLRRRNLTPGEEAAAIQDVISAGMSRKQLAGEIGESAVWVGQRVEYFTLEEDERRRVDDGSIPWSVVPDVAKLDDDGLAKFRRRNPYDKPADWIARHKRETAEAAERDSILASARRSNFTVIDEPTWKDPAVMLDRRMADSDSDTAKAWSTRHATDPCHAIAVVKRFYEDRWHWCIRTACTAPSRHDDDGASTLKWTEAETEQDDEQDDEHSTSPTSRNSDFDRFSAARKARDLNLIEAAQKHFTPTAKPTIEAIAEAFRLTHFADDPVDFWNLERLLGSDVQTMVCALTATEQVRTIIGLTRAVLAIDGHEETLAALTASGWEDPDPLVGVGFEAWKKAQNTTAPEEQPAA